MESEIEQFGTLSSEEYERKQEVLAIVTAQQVKTRQMKIKLGIQNP